MVTIDTSIVIAVASGESTRPAILQALAGQTVLAPASLEAEVGNSLSDMVKRRRVSLTDALEYLETIGRMDIRMIPIDLRAAVELAARLGVYAYDAYPIACAQSSGTVLLSLDRRQCNAARIAGVTAVHFPADVP